MCFRSEPYQRRLQALAHAANGNAADMDWVAYTRLSRRWFSMSTLAILAPATAVALMVFKST